MVKTIWRVGLFGLALGVAPLAFANNFFNRDPQFTAPAGDIAFMGCYWSPLSILGTGQPVFSAPPPAPMGHDTTVYNGGNVKVGVNGSAAGGLLADALIGDQPAPSPAAAIIQANQAVSQKSVNLGLTLSPVTYSIPYQNALLMHILSPAKWGYNPGLTRFCGNRPYILIGVMDYCDAYPSAVKVREKENDQPVTYFGKRSILEQNGDVFAPKGEQHVSAMTFFLVSTVDGKTLWQGTLMNAGGKMAGYQGLTEGLVENALKNLMKK